MPPEEDNATASPLDSAGILQYLRRHVLLPLSDADIPSLTWLAAGEPIRGSWWGNAKGADIYAALVAVSEDEDVLACKLLAGKVTFVHRIIWANVVAVGSSREPWQLATLTQEGAVLLDEVDDKQTVVAGDSAVLDAKPSKVRSKVVRELEQRLLIHTDEVHTEHGSHSKVLQHWDYWCDTKQLQRPLPGVHKSKRRIEELVADLGCDPAALLPWLETRPSHRRLG